MSRDIIGIFLGKDRIVAASVNKRKEYRQISFQGEYSYQIDDCIRCHESTYNVDTLSELDVNDDVESMIKWGRNQNVKFQ